MNEHDAYSWPRLKLFTALARNHSGHESIEIMPLRFKVHKILNSTFQDAGIDNTICQQPKKWRQSLPTITKAAIIVMSFSRTDWRTHQPIFPSALCTSVSKRLWLMMVPFRFDFRTFSKKALIVVLHFNSRLLQEFAVDAFCTMQEQLLSYTLNPQWQLRAETYDGHLNLILHWEQLVDGLFIRST